MVPATLPPPLTASPSFLFCSLNLRQEFVGLYKLSGTGFFVREFSPTGNPEAIALARQPRFNLCRLQSYVTWSSQNSELKDLMDSFGSEVRGTGKKMMSVN
jgi:hypothetical protein